MQEYFIGFLSHKLPAVFLIVGLSLVLAARKKSENANLRHLWVVVISAGLLAVAEFVEWHLHDPSLVFLRILLSVVGYAMRSQCVLGLLLATETTSRSRRLLWIPQIVLSAVLLLAFLPYHLVFWYDAQGEFYRGPLGYIVFVVPGYYILRLLGQVIRRFRENSKREAMLILLCLGFGVAEMLVEVIWSGSNLETMLLISALLYYIFIRLQNTDRDALTGLKNRGVYYDERERYDDIITAVAFIDLNGLKLINDVIGHDEGDRALAIVGNAMLGVVSKDVHAYRIGGDEFVLLFIGKEEEDVEKIVTRVREEVHRNGLSVAAGYAVRKENESVRELAHHADQNMYADKAEYYRQREYDRRKQ